MGIETRESKWFQPAQDLLQQAYNLDTGLPASLSREAILSSARELGPLVLHRAYYDSGISAFTEVSQLLRDKPNGVFATVIKLIRDLRVANGDYDQATLDRIYGLEACEPE